MLRCWFWEKNNNGIGFGLFWRKDVTLCFSLYKILSNTQIFFTEMGDIYQWFSKCGSRTSSMAISWELLAMGMLEIYPRLTELKLELGQ